MDSTEPDLTVRQGVEATLDLIQRLSDAVNRLSADVTALSERLDRVEKKIAKRKNH